MEAGKRHLHLSVILVGIFCFSCIYKFVPHDRLLNSAIILFDQPFSHHNFFRNAYAGNQSVTVKDVAVSSDVNTYKKVLIWTKWNGEKLQYDKNNQPGWFKMCPENRCMAVTDRRLRKTADAIVFYMAHFSSSDIPKQEARNQSTYYIFHLDESPDTTKELMNYKAWDNHPGFFNLTMTYRTDSDIYSDLYTGGYEAHHFNHSRLKDPLWLASKRDILWLVSHCDTASKREEYAAKLGNYVAFDKLGNCDQPDPCKLSGSTRCTADDLMSRYKFYLSFENSLCKEYATEKLYRALNNDVVPVVFGDADYKKLLPPNAVINVEDYESPKALAAYLTQLMKNPVAYAQHLTWKYPSQPLWHLPEIPTKAESSWCRMCEILHRPPKERIRKSYKSMVDWWFTGQCRESLVKFKKNQSGQEFLASQGYHKENVFKNSQ